MGEWVTNEELRDGIEGVKALMEEHYRLLDARLDGSAEDRQQLNVRVGALETRTAVTTAEMAAMHRAVRLQLAVSDWFAAHKIRVRVLAWLGFVGGIAIGPLINVLFKKIGWL